MWYKSKKKVWSQTCAQVKSVEESISIEKLCKVFGKSRQAYYDAINRKNRCGVDKEIIRHHVIERRHIQPKEGARKLYHNLKPVLQSEGIKIGRDKFIKTLRELDLLVKRRKRGKRTTNSNHPFYKYPNLIKELVVDRSEMVWVCDITYLHFKNSFVYLSLITDLYSHKIVGFHLHDTLKTIGPQKALEKALKKRCYPERELIHHSDKGIQYCSYTYTNLLKSNGIKVSMAEAGNPYENAVAERVNGILKDEYNLDSIVCNTFEELNNVIDNSIWIYNNLRSHASCDYLTPDEAHRRTGELKKRWSKKTEKV